MLYFDIAKTIAERKKCASFDLAIVVDLFRATSTIQVLVDRHCRVILFNDLDSFILALDKNRVSVGEWKGDMVEGACFHNSPSDLLDSKVKNIDVNFLSSNGSKALMDVSLSRKAICASLFNLNAILEVIKKMTDASILLVPAGAKGGSRIEDDYVCAKIALLAMESRKVKLSEELIKFSSVHNIDSDIRQHLRKSDGAKYLFNNGFETDFNLITGGVYQSAIIPVFGESGVRGESISTFLQSVM